MRDAAGRRAENGFTLIETMFAMVLLSILVGISVGPYSNYRGKQEHKGATRELVAFLRRAQVRAVAEETTYRVDLAADGKSARAFRFNGTGYSPAQVIRTPSGRIRYQNPAFTAPTGVAAGSATGMASIYFYARGSASKGSVTVVRDGSGKVYTVDVEGLTARVSYE